MNWWIIFGIITLAITEVWFLLERKKPEKGDNIFSFTASRKFGLLLISLPIAGIITLVSYAAWIDWENFIRAGKIILIGLATVGAIFGWIALNSLKFRIKHKNKK